MTRGRLVLVCVGVLGIGLAYRMSKSHEPSEPSAETDGAAGVPKLDAPAPGANYELTSSDVPLTVDYRKYAAKRVTPDNYRRALTEIERELDALAASND
jgi:hypothetical protein